jgi:TolA-binding protein
MIPVIAALPLGAHVPALAAGAAEPAEHRAPSTEHASAASSEAAEDQYLFATELFGKKMYALAVQQYEAFLREHPGHPKAFQARLRVGEGYLRLKQVEKSIRAYEAALATKPDSQFRGELLVGLGVALYHGKQYPRAGQVLAEARPLVAEDKTLGPVAANWLGEALFHQGRYAEAAKAYEGVGQWPSSEYAAQALYSLGFCQLKQGQTEAAVATFRRVAKEYPKSPYAADALARAGAALQRADKHSEAETLLREAAEKAPESEAGADAAWGLAASAYAQKQYPEARTRFEQFRAKYPSGPRAAEALMRIGDCYFREGNYAEAATRYAKAAEGLSGDLQREARYWQGMARWKAGDGNGAVETFTSLAQSDAKDEFAQKARLRLGDLEASRGNTDAALRAYAACVAANPESPHAEVAAYDGATLALRTGRRDEAEQALAQFEKQYPKSPKVPSARLAQAQSRFDRKDVEGARAILEGLTNTATGETRASALLLLGRCYAAQKDPAKAESAWKAIVEAHPQSPLAPRALLRLARLQSDAKQYPEARKTIQGLLDVYPKSPQTPEALYELGWTSSEAGDAAAAREAWERLAREYPSHPLVGESLFRIAESDYAAKRFEVAAAGYRQVLESKAGAEFGDRAAYKLGWSERQLGNHAAAAVAFAKVYSTYPKSELAFESRIRAGEALAEQGKWREARVEFEAAVKEGEASKNASHLARARLGLGRARIETGDLEGGIAALRAAASTRNGAVGAEAQFRIADSAFARRDYGRAIEEHLRVTLLFAAHPAWAARSQYQLGEAYRLQGDHAEAKAAYRKCVETYPNTRWAALSEERLAAPAATPPKPARPTERRASSPSTEQAAPSTN